MACEHNTFVHIEFNIIVNIGKSVRESSADRIVGYNILKILKKK